MRILAILCVKNEGAFLLEWLAHHRAIGFTDFLVFSNDCTDGTDLMLDRLAEMGLVTHVRNDGPYSDQGIQFTAMNLAAKHPLVQRADWIAALDIDEFVNVHVGQHKVTDLISALPDATAITLTWRNFGNGGVLQYVDTPITEQFTRAAPAVMYWPWRMFMFKTLYSNDGTYRKPGVHRPRAPHAAKIQEVNWFDGNGAPLREPFMTKRIFSDFGKDNYGLVQLNHYPLGAMESYLLKCDRGRAVHSEDRLGMDYWCERNYVTDQDTTILRTKAKREAAHQVFAEDKPLINLHNQAVAWRTARIQKLLEQEPYRALMGRLMVTPPATPLSPKSAQYLRNHAINAKS